MPILGPMGIDTHWIRHKSQFIEHGIFEVDRFCCQFVIMLLSLEFTLRIIRLSIPKKGKFAVTEIEKH